ncbi:hypothetical protein CJF32_00001101 [Rutstroemia sp. NJR-2017a WRK4]|nr:hypothetical protein CJF32_00001101 [Rutstroemia sp. NJR-2017a WRK4]
MDSKHHMELSVQRSSIYSNTGAILYYTYERISVDIDVGSYISICDCFYTNKPDKFSLTHIFSIYILHVTVKPDNIFPDHILSIHDHILSIHDHFLPYLFSIHASLLSIRPDYFSLPDLLTIYLVNWTIVLAASDNNRRRKGRKQGEKGPAEPSTYSQVNDSFAGVSFVKNNSHFSTPQYSVMTDTSYQGAGQYMHDGQPTPFSVSHEAAMETDQFLPAYDELPTPHPLHLVATTGANSLAPSDPFASRPTTRDPFTDQNRLSQHTMTIPSEPNTPIRPLLRHDTMGFPLDDEDTSYLAQSQSPPHFPAPFPLEPLSPPPTRPLPLPPFQFPAPQRTYTNSSSHSRPSTASLSRSSSLSSNATFTPAFVQLLNRQSQSLSQPLSQSPPPPQPTNHLHRQQTNTSEYEYGDIVSPLSIQGNWGGFGNVGLSRNMSQRTQSSFAPSVISETELERLGVGMRF